MTLVTKLNVFVNPHHHFTKLLSKQQRRFYICNFTDWIISPQNNLYDQKCRVRSLSSSIIRPDPLIHENKATTHKSTPNDKQDAKWYEMLEQLSLYKEQHHHTNVPINYPILGNWVKNQRNLYKRNNLQPHREKALLELDFQLDPYSQSWETMLEQLKEYKQKHGHVFVPRIYPPNKALGRWVSTQRKAYKLLMEDSPQLLSSSSAPFSSSPRMNRHRIQQLQDIGFIFDALEYSWQSMYQQLKEYIQKHGDGNVPKKYNENPVLGTWVQTQRNNYKAWTEDPHSIYFPKHRRDALDALNFVWDIYETGWNEQYFNLEGFKAAHGHCMVPFTYESDPSLGLWVAAQRRQYNYLKEGKLSTLTSERKILLEKLGFVWDVRAFKWQQQFEELVDFIELNGHSFVPMKQSPLGPWVNTQRRQYALWKNGKKSRLTEERRNMLERIGFQWETTK